MKQETKLVISWCGAAAMTSVFAMMMAVDNMKVERYFRSRHSRSSKITRIERVRRKTDSTTLKLVAR